MKWCFLSLLFLSVQVSAKEVKEISPTLKASIQAAKELQPELYKEIRGRLSVIQKSCRDAPGKIASVQGKGSNVTTVKGATKDRLLVQNMSMHISNALGSEIKHIDKSISTEGLCLETLFQGSLLGIATKEALTYLRGVQKDVNNKDYVSCASKLDKLLKVGGK